MTGGDVYGFLESDGIFTTISDPLAAQGDEARTLAGGINDLGQITGDYSFGGALFANQAFVATTESPEPSTFNLLFAALLGVTCYSLRKRLFGL
jgi:hypothetical protein